MEQTTRKGEGGKGEGGEGGGGGRRGGKGAELQGYNNVTTGPCPFNFILPSEKIN